MENAWIVILCKRIIIFEISLGTNLSQETDVAFKIFWRWGVGFDPFIHLLWKGEMAICPNFVIFLVSWQFMPSLYNFMNLVLSGLGGFFAFSLLFMRHLKNTQKTLMYVYHTTICHEIENKTDSLIDFPTDIS